MSHPCVDCGERDPVVLDFDHVSGVKRFNVAGEVYRSANLAKIQAEVAKCDVRCSNCHRRKTNGASFKGRMKLFESLDLSSSLSAPTIDS